MNIFTHFHSSLRRHKHGLLLVLLLTLGLAPCAAETKAMRDTMRHELRLGWGDQLFETLIWHERPSVTTTGSRDDRYTYSERFRYSQHLFLEYQYRINYWLGVGGLVDASGVKWDVVTRDGTGAYVSTDEQKHYLYNAVVMPTVRFTYLHHPYVNLYSGLGIGMCVHGSSEPSYLGKTTTVSAAADFTLLGLSANYGRWFAAVEYGGMYALKNKNMLLMIKSRMFTASIGCRF